MTSSNVVIDRHLFETLDDLLARLRGGQSSIEGLNTWFMSSEWEARMADDSSALRLGWVIQNLLYTWQDFGDEITADWILQGIRDLIVEEPSLRPFFPMLLGEPTGHDSAPPTDAHTTFVQENGNGALADPIEYRWRLGVEMTLRPV